MTRDRETARRIAQEVQPLGGSVYYVGGCVRDRLLGRESKDLDIEVHGVTPQQLEIVLDRMGGRRTVGASFGVYGLAGCGLDIAMPRRETTVGRGHRDFTVEVDPWLGPERAARRRDFTVNALMEDVLTGQVLDFFGGREDLRRGLLRHVDDHSFPEDPLRVLRGAQFAARFGFTVAEETVALCRTMDLSALSRERVEGELQKALLQAPRPSIFFRTLDTMHQLRPWFTEVQRLQGVPQPPRYHGEGDVWEHTMAVLDTAAELRPQAAQPMALMLAALAHDFGKVAATTESGGVIHAYGHEEAGLPPAEDFLRRVIGEKALHRCVKNLVALHMKPNAMALSGASVKSTNRLLDAAIEPGDLILLALADHRGSRCDPPRPDPEPFLRQRLEIYRAAMARPMVTGSDSDLRRTDPGSGLLPAAGLRPQAPSGGAQPGGSPAANAGLRPQAFKKASKRRLSIRSAFFLWSFLQQVEVHHQTGEHDGDHAQQLDEDVDGGAGGILEGIAHGVAHHACLVAVGALAAAADRPRCTSSRYPTHRRRWPS